MAFKALLGAEPWPHDSSYAVVRYTRKYQGKGFHRNVAARRESRRAIAATPQETARICCAMLRDRVPQRESGTDYGALMVGRNAPLWLRQFDRFGKAEPTGDGTLRVNRNARNAEVQ